MTAQLPRPDDPPAVWRRFASANAADAGARGAVLTALPTLPEATQAAVMPGLIHRARGAAKREALALSITLSARRPPGTGEAYVLAGELLSTSGAGRAACARALRTLEGAWARALDLSLSAAARMRSVRDAGDHEAAALAAWREAGGGDPLAGLDAGALWRAWLDGASGDPAVDPDALDHALLLAGAGAPRAAGEHLRKVAEHVIRGRGYASPGAAELLGWLARNCDAEDLPRGVQNPAWVGTAARALARTALRAAGPAATLRHVAATVREGALERALASEALRACVLAAREGFGNDTAALGEAVECFADALASVREPSPDWPALVAMLLGREASGAMLGAGRWLTDDLRARVHAVALANPALGAERVALSDLETGGVPASVVPALREIARTHPDAITRQHARQLGRGEHL